MLKLDRRLVIAAAGWPLLGAAPKPAAKPALKPAAPAPPPEDMSLGNPKARVKVVEYASAACSHCAAFNNDVFPAFKARYIDTGKVHYTLKEYLTEPAQLAVAGFLLARCAGKDRYFAALDGVFRAQGAIFQVRNLSPLVGVAKAQGMDEARLTACLSDQAAVKALEARARRHQEVDRIDGTPTFLINGKLYEGEHTLAGFDLAISAAAR